MNKYSLRSSIAGAFGLLATSPAVAQDITITHPDGTNRIINCQEAFYRFTDDPKKNLWMTCHGFEAADKPLGGDKAYKENPNNRDGICEITDKYNPQNPISINDPAYNKARNDFSTAMNDAITHGSVYHGNSLYYGIRVSGRIGKDPFVQYDNKIARPSEAEINTYKEEIATYRADRANNPLPQNMSSFKGPSGNEIFYKFTNGWTMDKALWSPYADATRACIVEMGLN